MSSSEAIKQIPVAVGGLVKKLEEAAKNAVAQIEAKGNETLNKVDRAVTAVTAPLRDADAILDDIIGGHNGEPVEDDVKSPTPFPAVPALSRPGAATAAAPQPSKLGVPTGGVTATDVKQ